MNTLLETLASLHPVWAGFIGSLIAGSATFVGAIPALGMRTLSARSNDSLIGFAAGIMLAATFFSLIVPGLDAAAEAGWGEWGSLAVVSGGIAAGTLFLVGAHHVIPHEHPVVGPAGPQSRRIRRIWLFVFAIAIHNVPEGMAVGIAMGRDPVGGVGVMTGIGLQNMPEGLAVAVALATIGYSRMFAVLVAGLTGLLEPVAGLLGAALIWLFSPLLPFGLGFAGGAMLFVITAEMIPEISRGEGPIYATVSLIFGFLVMMALDVGFG